MKSHKIMWVVGIAAIVSISCGRAQNSSILRASSAVCTASMHTVGNIEDQLISELPEAIVKRNIHDLLQKDSCVSSKLAAGQILILVDRLLHVGGDVATKISEALKSAPVTERVNRPGHSKPNSVGCEFELATLSEIEDVRQKYLNHNGSFSKRRSIDLISENIRVDRCFASASTRGFDETTAEAILSNPNRSAKDFLSALWKILNR